MNKSEKMKYEEFLDMMHRRGWNYGKASMRIAYIGYSEAYEDTQELEGKSCLLGCTKECNADQHGVPSECANTKFRNQLRVVQ